MLRIFVFVLTVLFVFSIVEAETKDSDTKAVQSFPLTEAKLDQFTKSVKNAADTIQKTPQLLQEEESEEVEGIAGIVASIDKKPELKKAIESSGMTTRDFVLFEMAVINGASGAWLSKQGQKVPPEITPEQVEFYKAHEAKIKAIKDQMDAVQSMLDQEDEEDEDEEDEEEDE